MTDMSQTSKTPHIHRVGIIMNGVTGRMGMNQHLLRSVVAIRDEGGITLPDDSIIIPDPILVGRNRTKLQELASRANIPAHRVTTSFDDALADPYNIIFFDAGTTQMRYDLVKRAIAAGKHIYVEKPCASTLDQSLELARLAEQAGVKHGVVQDKLFLPGIIKLARLIESGFFGEVLSVRGEFGYWVFSGLEEDGGQTPQRPSWNYKAEEGGGIISDMVPHWQYVLDHLFGGVKALNCVGKTEVKERIDEQGQKYNCTADDACYAHFELDNGAIASFNSSWTTRVRRDDLLTIQIDGSKGSAVAGLNDVRVQSGTETPRPVWNPDMKGSTNYHEGWKMVEELEVYKNAFRAQWEMFLKHVIHGEQWQYGLEEGAKGTQLTEMAMRSSKERRWVQIPPLRREEGLSELKP